MSVPAAPASHPDTDPDPGPDTANPNAAIDIAHLTFSFPHSSHSYLPALHNLSLSLPRGARCLLIGANGAGKSTLLHILAGKRLTPASARVHIFGSDVFQVRRPRANNADANVNVTFLGTEWATNPVVRGDISVSVFLDSIGGYRHPERRDRLLDLLDVDLDWHMHAISDGERRRVQLVMGLMAPWDVLLLDEVTVDLDVLVRDELMMYLKEESETRGATILYATHIFDGLESFPTHLAHMRFGSLVAPPITWHPSSPSSLSLHTTALQWLKEDRAYRRQLEASASASAAAVNVNDNEFDTENGERQLLPASIRGMRTRGARRGQKEPTDSETFFRKYDYSN